MITYIADIQGTPEVKGDDDAAVAKWFDLDEPLPPLAFDHKQILEDAIDKCRLHKTIK